MDQARFRLLSLLLLSFMIIPSAMAQDNATINGTIADSTGAFIPNTQVTLTNPATGQARQVKSSNAGAYQFSNVGVGSYTLSASAQGFERYTKAGIVVNVAEQLEENVVLNIGSEAQTVTIQANALHLQTETNELSTLISGQQATQISTNGRNFTQLAALGLGVSNTLPDFNTVNANTSGNTISFDGTRSTGNNYVLDGEELNDRGCGGCFDVLPSVDALAEFQTLESNYTPDYGIGAGGTTLMVIKSGTRSFHGELYEFNRNEDYDANNYFTKLAHEPRPELRLNEPGGNIGGPLWIPHVYNDSRTRTFFFVNEEWRRLILGSTPSVVNTIADSNFPTSGQSLTYTVPSNGTTPIVPVTSDLAKLATYAADGLTPGQPFPGNTIPANLIDQNAVLELNAGTFPKANYGSSQFISSVPQPTNVREDVVRIDHTINAKLQLMGHYVHDAVTHTSFPPQWGDSSYPTTGSTMLNPAWMAAFRLTQLYSPSLLNETSFFYTDNTVKITPVGVATQPAGWTATTFFPSTDNADNRMPEIDLGAPYGTNWSSNYFPWKNFYASYNIRDDLSWTRRRHQFKFGVGYLRTVKNQQLQANTQGTAVFNSSTFSGDSYVNFLLGDAESFTQLNYLADKHWVNNNYSGYGNDDWHITSNLTLNLGVRYDGLPHTFERYNQFANFVPADYNAALGYPLSPAGTLNPTALTTYDGAPFYLNGIEEAGVNGFPRGNVQNHYYTVQPRVGFAYTLPGDGKTVFRGGYGIFYERVQGNDVYNAAQNPPFAYQPSATNVYFSNPNTSAITGVTTSESFPSTLTNLQYKYSPPGTEMFSLGLQREVAPSIIAVLQYGGSTGWDQNDDRGINTLPLTATNSADPANPYYDREGVANGTLNANLYRIYPGFSSILQEEDETGFSYNSLQAGLRIENRHGLTVQLAYTWSHEIDEVSEDLNSLSDPFNPKYDRGSGAVDRRNIFNANYIYAIPFFAHASNGVVHNVLGGWEFSGITIAQSGVPQPLTYNGSDTLGLGGDTTNRPDEVGSVRYPKKLDAWFNTSAFASPIAPWNGGTNQGFGTAPKDAIVLPGRLNFNLSLFKTIAFKRDGPNLELRFESFNTFNHTQFDGIDSGFTDANFGQVTSAYDPRVLQLGAKFHF